MALSSSILADEMKVNMDAIAESYRNGEKDNKEMLTALAEAIILHFETYAEVNITTGSSAGTYNVE